MPALGTHPLATDVVFADQLQAGTFPRANDAGALQLNSIAGTVIDSGSALFDGDSVLRANSNLSLTSGYTVAVQFNPASGGSAGRPISITWGDADYLELWSGSGFVRGRLRSGAGVADAEIASGFTPNAWNSVAVIVTATEVYLWLNGTMSAPASRVGVSPSGSDSYITVGGLSRGGGSLQDFVPNTARVRNVILWQGGTNGAMTDTKLDQWAADPSLPYSGGGGGSSIGAGLVQPILLQSRLRGGLVR